MLRVTTKKAMEIIEKFEELTGDSYEIRKGSYSVKTSQGYQYKDGYHLFRRSIDGVEAVGAYGNHVTVSKTLKGLLEELAYQN